MGGGGGGMPPLGGPGGRGPGKGAFPPPYLEKGSKY